MPPALAIRAVKRTITDARQRQPVPATMYAHGVAAPAEMAAAEVAVATPSASESSASDCANASARLRMPCRSSPTDHRDRCGVLIGSVIEGHSFLVGYERKDAHRGTVRGTDLEGRDDDRRALRKLIEVGRVLDDEPARAEPDAVQVERRRVDRICRRAVESDRRDALVDQRT